PSRLAGGQGAGVPPVRFDLPRPGRVHRGEVRVGDDDLMAEPLEAAGDPLALGRGLDENPALGGADRAPPRSAHAWCGCAARRVRRLRPGCRSCFLLWTSMPIWSMAGPSLLRR